MRTREWAQFGGYSTTKAGTSTHLGDRNLCYGDGLEGRGGHYWSPQWDLFMIEIMDRSGSHHVPIEPHRLRNGKLLQRTLSIRCVCVCLLSFAGDFHCRLPGDFPFASGIHVVYSLCSLYAL